MITRRISKANSLQKQSINAEFSEITGEQKPADCELHFTREVKKEMYRDADYEYDYFDDEIFEDEHPEPSAANGATRRKRTKKTRDVFTHEESLHIFQFLLGEITSRSEERQGRVAKRRVELSSTELWEKYKMMFDLRRDPSAYRANFRATASRLHNFPDLTLLEKADLFYGLDIKVNKAFWPKLIKHYGVQFNEEGIITGSTVLTHWDLVHPDTDREDEIQVARKTKNWNRFTEFDDGVMWEFVLDYMQTSDYIHINAMSTWNDFKKQYADHGINMHRSAETYRGRYNRMLVPNLHKMPFDIETKAAIYQTLGYVVPEEFRQQLIDETGVELDEYGRVVEYADRPERLVLQSRPYEDTTIGITSAHKVSSLLSPNSTGDTVPYTTEEDDMIWNYIIQHARGKTTSKESRRVTGWLFWKRFLEQHETTRTWQSLCNHFTNDLLENLMDMDFDMKTKIALFFCLKLPVEDDLLPLFQAATEHLVLREDRKIRYASGQDENGESFEFGRRVTPLRFIPQPSEEKLAADTWHISEWEKSTDEEEDAYEIAGFRELEDEDEDQPEDESKYLKSVKVYSKKAPQKRKSAKLSDVTPDRNTPAPVPALPALGTNNSMMYPYVPPGSKIRKTFERTRETSEVIENTRGSPVEVREEYVEEGATDAEDPFDDSFEEEEERYANPASPSPNFDYVVVKEEPIDDMFMYNSDAMLEKKPEPFLNPSSESLNDLRNDIEEQADYLESLVDSKRRFRERTFDPEEDHDYLYCKRARFEDEPSTSYSPNPALATFYGRPNAPIEAAFEDMEKHIKNFCKRLKRDSPRLSNHECAAYLDRLNYLIKMFSSNARDALKKKCPRK